MTDLLMPSLGADMESGTLITWEKEPGDHLKRGDVIAVVETQKGAIEIEVFEDGVLESCLVNTGKEVPVGTPIAEIHYKAAVETVTSEKESSMPSTAHQKKPDKDPESVKPPVVKKIASRIKITPVARKVATDINVDFQSIAGTGPQGEIVLSDIVSASQYIPEFAEATEIATDDQGPTGMRQAIATAMTRSKKEIPHYYLSHTADLTNANVFIADINADRAPENRLLSGALFAKALAVALKRYPEFNGFFKDGEFQPQKSAHIGMAINIRSGGLVAPAIHNVQDLDLDSLMGKMHDLIVRVRAGRFRSAELNDPTITLSSLGERGVDSLYGVIYPPQVAIVGFGAPAVRPWVVGEKIEARTLVKITLAADHRVSDGHRGALFLNAIQKLLNKPEKL